MVETTLCPTSAVGTIDAKTTARVLSEIADIASETLELEEVFGRVADSVRKLIPFDNTGVVRIVGGDLVALHATTLDCGGKCFEPIPSSHWSPRWRPSRALSEDR